MEKQILEKNENMMSICHRTNDEFLKGLLFVTYYLKQNPYNDDLEDAKEYWIYTNNFIDDWKNTFPYLYETLEEKERVLKDLFFDAEQVISFYLEDTNQSTSSLSNAVSELINSLSIDEIKTALVG